MNLYDVGAAVSAVAAGAYALNILKGMNADECEERITYLERCLKAVARKISDVDEREHQVQNIARDVERIQEWKRSGWFNRALVSPPTLSLKYLCVYEDEEDSDGGGDDADTDEKENDSRRRAEVAESVATAETK